MSRLTIGGGKPTRQFGYSPEVCHGSGSSTGRVSSRYPVSRPRKSDPRLSPQSLVIPVQKSICGYFSVNFCHRAGASTIKASGSRRRKQ